MPDVKQITRPPRLRPPKNNPWPSNPPQAETGKALDLPALHQVVEGACKVGWRKRRVRTIAQEFASRSARQTPALSAALIPGRSGSLLQIIARYDGTNSNRRLYRSWRLRQTTASWVLIWGGGFLQPTCVTGLLFLLLTTTSTAWPEFTQNFACLC